MDCMPPGAVSDRIENERALTTCGQETTAPELPQVARDLILRKAEDRHEFAHAQIRRLGQQGQDSEPCLVRQEPEESRSTRHRQTICGVEHTICGWEHMSAGSPCQRPLRPLLTRRASLREPRGGVARGRTAVV